MNNELSSDRIKRLKDLGFALDPLEAAWEKMFVALIAHKQAHGDCNITSRRKDKHKLWVWCGAQRQQHKKGKLSPDRVTRLEQLGFRFRLIESKKK